MRPIATLAALAFVALLAPARAADLVQVSTLGALMTGVFDGETTLGELGRRGDLGLGTTNGLDGELLAVDGQFYRIHADGHAVLLPPDTRTPFAMITAFTPEITAPLPAGLDLAGLEAWLDRLLPPANHPQAVRIDGRFERLSVRSVPRQTAPYPPLLTALRQQVVMAHESVRGTVIGFRLPTYLRGINAPGFHFHFIDETRAFGGHVLGLTTGEGQAMIAGLDGVSMILPHDAAFGAAVLGDGIEVGANAVEGLSPPRR
jgi:acetolactate decarboxylase